MISCIVRGLTRQLDAVQWTKSDDCPVISGEDGLTVDPGSFSGSSQTTTLTVDGLQNNQDAIYNCVITSYEHGFTGRSTAVNLKVFSKYVYGLDICCQINIILPTYLRFHIYFSMAVKADFLNFRIEVFLFCLPQTTQTNGNGGPLFLMKAGCYGMDGSLVQLFRTESWMRIFRTVRDRVLGQICGHCVSR